MEAAFSRNVIMSNLLETIAKALVDHPDAVVVTEEERDDALVLSLSVDPEDVGKVIGKGGKRAQAIRTIIRAQHLRDGQRVIVDIQG